MSKCKRCDHLEDRVRDLEATQPKVFGPAPFKHPQIWDEVPDPIATYPLPQEVIDAYRKSVEDSKYYKKMK